MLNLCAEFMDNVTDRSNFNINDLPAEILLHLFSFFSQKELLLTVAPVCQLWRALSYDPLFWRTLSFDLDNSNITSKTLQNCFARSHLLHSLEISGRRYLHHSLPVADILCCASYCKNVVNLQLRFVSNLDLQMTAELVHNFPLLENLNV